LYSLLNVCVIFVGAKLSLRLTNNPFKHITYDDVEDDENSKEANQLLQMVVGRSEDNLDLPTPFYITTVRTCGVPGSANPGGRGRKKVLANR